MKTARERFSEWRRKKKLSVVEVSDLLRCHRAYVYELEKNYSKKNMIPSRKRALDIQALTGIPASAWEKMARDKWSAV